MIEKVEINNTLFILHPSGAIYWESEKALLIADVHLGKATHFRKHGIALPETLVYTNFSKLNEVVTKFNPEYIYFLGDLFHSTHNKEWNLFEDWVQQQTARITLVVGNHDIIDKALFTAIGVAIASRIDIHGFTLTHHPEELPDTFNMCGHIHPGFKLRGIGKQVLKLPCFVKKANQLVLPAFGDFTGKFYIDKHEAETFYVCSENEVFEVKI